jgi:3'-5' exoribonuclease
MFIVEVKRRHKADLFLRDWQIHHFERWGSRLPPNALLLAEQPFKEEAFMKQRASSQPNAFHHCYIGGLADHTLEVARLVLTGLKQWDGFTEQDEVAAIVGTIWHDYGKIWDYSLTTGLKHEGRTKESHTKDGIVYFTGATQEHCPTSVDATFTRKVCDIIASHHGLLKYGALKEPSTKIEVLVHMADYYSAMSYDLNLKRFHNIDV